MVVYADVLFLVNFISSYVMLYLLGRFIIKTEIKKLRLLLASAIGGIAAVIIFSMEIPLVISYIFRALSAVIMVFIAFFERKRQFARHALWLLAISGMLIAAMSLIAVFSGRTVGVIIKSGIIYFNLPQKIFLPMLVLSYILVTLFIKFMQNKRAKRRYIITVTKGDKTVTVPALFDSGNLLKEPVTGKCVSILEWNEARRLFDADYDFGEIGSHAEDMKLWAVPFHSLGKRSGIIFAFLADRIEVAEEKKIIENTFVALYGGRLSRDNEYNALLNAALF